ncbi:MAG TPA: hypothetical protein PK910_09185 [Bacteroidales bacterium]|nr:hypothetical protein [Bacteroidales bacterium]
MSGSCGCEIDVRATNQNLWRGTWIISEIGKVIFPSVYIIVG